MNRPNKFVFGSMNIDKISDRSALDLLRFVLEKGVRRFHTSFEYDSYGLFGTLMEQACSDMGVKSNLIEYTVKLASPHFGEKNINSKEIINRVDSYRSFLNVECIHQIQWMARMDLQDENGRLELLDRELDVLHEVKTALTNTSAINQFGCFPYTVRFAKKILESNVIDVMMDYLNENDSRPLEYAEYLQRASAELLVLRPFDAGKSLTNEQSAVTIFKELTTLSYIDGIAVGVSSIEHAEELLEKE